MPDAGHGFTPYVERDLCLGAGYCLRAAPGAFALDDEEIAVVTDPAAASAAELTEAAELCPAGAVYLQGPTRGDSR